VTRLRRVTLMLLVAGSFVGFASPVGAGELETRLREHARPLSAEADLDQLLSAAASARVVLLGEATHGTREFYEWRAAITRRLIQEQGVTVVAVEGDWRPMIEVDAYGRGEGTADEATEVLRLFKRWPQWMWANQSFAELIEWIRQWNTGRGPSEQVRIRGLDLYGFGASLHGVEAFFRRHLPRQSKTVRRHYARLRRYRGDGQTYASDILAGGRSAESGVRAVVDLLRDPALEAGNIPQDKLFVARQDASIVKRAEAFYRATLEPGERSWNVRAEHMWLTLARLLEHHGPEARAVVWAHNTHVGDARATDMATTGAINIGQLSREALGPKSVFIVGFATHRGETIAGKSWGGRRRVLSLPPARRESWDGVLQRAGGGDHWLLLDDAVREDPLLRPSRPQRAIGVVYNPKHESVVNYTQTVLPSRFDALIFIAESHALEPLHSPN
jgi:erythromycin esterase